MDFFTGKSIIADYRLYFGQKLSLKINAIMVHLFLTNMQLSVHKMLIDGLE